MTKRPTEHKDKQSPTEEASKTQDSVERRNLEVYGGRRETDRIIRRLIELGIALSAERDADRLLEMILMEAKQIYASDGGTIYLTTDDDQGLEFKIVRNDSLKISQGGTTGEAIPFPPVPLFSEDGSPNLNNVASAVWHQRASVNIEDAYNADDYDFSGTKKFDQHTGYRSKSFLTIPMINTEDEVIGVLQLINASDDSGEIIPFEAKKQPLIEALTSQAAVTIDNVTLISGQRKLWDALIKMLATAIDDKSPYTGRHCERVPVLTKLLVEAACNCDSGVFQDFNLTEDQWYELHVAAWLHDCGKLTTPEFVVDKASKLETIYNRIHEVRTRFEVLRRDAEIACLKAQLEGLEKEKAEALFAESCQRLEEEFEFVARCNLGGEFMEEADVQRLREISAQTWCRHFDKSLGLGPAEHNRLTPCAPTPSIEPLMADLPEHHVGKYNYGELYNLSISRGTLTAEERNTMNEHIVLTIKMLEGLPFPKKMRRVPEYAGGHHEKMDGSGYPRGLRKEEMPLPTRAMAIADIFEALTAPDRPYKKEKTLNESLRIMSSLCDNNHIDPDLFDLFLQSGIWRQYATQFLNPNQVDSVDVEKLRPKARSASE